jgi:hypothetical protein
MLSVREESLETTMIVRFDVDSLMFLRFCNKLVDLEFVHSTTYQNGDRKMRKVVVWKQ